jgi:hypothetical protein
MPLDDLKMAHVAETAPTHDLIRNYEVLASNSASSFRKTNVRALRSPSRETHSEGVTSSTSVTSNTLDLRSSQ